MEFCSLRETEELLTRLGDLRQIESRIIDFIVSARDQVTYSYSSLKLTAIMAFYSINDLQLNRKKLGKFLGEEVKRHKDRPYTLEEIHRMLIRLEIRPTTIWGDMDTGLTQWTVLSGVY